MKPRRACEYFENRPRYAIPPLGRLIRIGCGPDRDRFPAWNLVQLVAKPGGVELLRENLPLELERIAELHEFVRVAGVAILAAELAAPVRIDGPAERHPGARAVSDVGARWEFEILDAALGFDKRAFGGEAGDADEFRHASMFAIYSPIVNSPRANLLRGV